MHDTGAGIYDGTTTVVTDTDAGIYDGTTTVVTDTGADIDDGTTTVIPVTGAETQYDSTRYRRIITYRTMIIISEAPRNHDVVPDADSGIHHGTPLPYYPIQCAS
jgi:molybdopterin biosynthesis enzyme